jgi:hypothetical protein
MRGKRVYGVRNRQSMCACPGIPDPRRSLLLGFGDVVYYIKWRIFLVRSSRKRQGLGAKGSAVLGAFVFCHIAGFSCRDRDCRLQAAGRSAQQGPFPQIGVCAAGGGSD